MTADVRPVKFLLSFAGVACFNKKINQWFEENIHNHPFNSKVGEI